MFGLYRRWGKATWRFGWGSDSVFEAHTGSHSYSVSIYLNQEVYRNKSEPASYSEIYTLGAECSLTANGKKAENAAKAIVSGRSLATLGTVVNSEFLGNTSNLWTWAMAAKIWEIEPYHNMDFAICVFLKVESWPLGELVMTTVQTPTPLPPLFGSDSKSTENQNSLPSFVD
jgi:hypothetical protein